MTAQGRATLDRYVNVQARRERQLLDRLSADDKQQLNDLLRKLLASLADQSRPPTP
jgi:DNA-binding MarR family transcriptional regulator